MKEIEIAYCQQCGKTYNKDAHHDELCSDCHKALEECSKDLNEQKEKNKEQKNENKDLKDENKELKEQKN